MSTTIVYKTGATSKAVNDLILFTDASKELTELRNAIFSNGKQSGDRIGYHTWFKPLLNKARAAYCNKNGGAASDHIIYMKDDEKLEFCSIYAYRFYTFSTNVTNTP